MTQDPRSAQNRHISRPSRNPNDPRHFNTPPRVTDRQVGLGLVLDEDGRITDRLPTDSPIYHNERGEKEIAVADGLKIASGSRTSIRMALADDSMEFHEGAVRARPSLDQVRGGAALRTTVTALASESTSYARVFLLMGA